MNVHLGAHWRERKFCRNFCLPFCLDEEEELWKGSDVFVETDGYDVQSFREEIMQQLRTKQEVRSENYFKECLLC